MAFQEQSYPRKLGAGWAWSREKSASHMEVGRSLQKVGGQREERRGEEERRGQERRRKGRFWAFCLHSRTPANKDGLRPGLQGQGQAELDLGLWEAGPAPVCPSDKDSA